MQTKGNFYRLVTKSVHGDFTAHVEAGPLDPVTIRVREPSEGRADGADNEPAALMTGNGAASSADAKVRLSTGEELSIGEEATVTQGAVVHPVAGEASIEVSTVGDGIGTVTLEADDQPIAISCSSDDPRRATVTSGAVYYRTVVDPVRLRPWEIAEQTANRIGAGQSKTFTRETWLKATATATVEVSAA